MTTPPSSAADPNADQIARPSATRADAQDHSSALEDWLAETLGPDAKPSVSRVEAPEEGGMSSDTLMVDAEWTEDGVRSPRKLVIRMPPQDEAMPVFPTYDFGFQAAVMGVVAEHSDIPVPSVLWHEADPRPLGREFIVMEHVDGHVPPDMLPYNFEGWLLEATEDQRRQIEDAAIHAIAGAHSIPEPQRLLPQLPGARDGHTVDARSALAAHIAAQREYYEWASDGGVRSPLIERALDVLSETQPALEGEAVLCWGDARIGNIIFDGYSPAAVVDWEMAALGPAELDVGWTIFFHRFFEDLAAMAGLPGLPDMFNRERVAAEYENESGRKLSHLDWFITYAALRHAVIMYRIHRRSVAYETAEQPDDPDTAIMHRATLEKMLDGTYWTELNRK